MAAAPPEGPRFLAAPSTEHRNRGILDQVEVGAGSRSFSIFQTIKIKIRYKQKKIKIKTDTEQIERNVPRGEGPK